MRKLLVAVTLIGLAPSCATPERPPAAAPPVEQPTGLAGGGRETPDPKPPQHAAPNFSVTTFDGDRFSLAEQRGTPVVLNFWESW